MQTPYLPAILLLLGLSGMPGAQAQGNPSANDIICKLRPDGCPDIDGRGIRLYEPPAPGAALTVDLAVQFKTNSAELTPDAVQTLNELGQALSNSALASYQFKVVGHTDTVGSREANRVLSERRAMAVTAYMVNRFGISRARLDAIGLGQDEPLVPTPLQTAEPRNRRVQVINLGR